MDRGAGQGSADWRDILLLFATILGGFLAFALLGMAARDVLIQRGIAVMSLERGARLLLPLALVFEIPVLVVAVMNLRTMRRIGTGAIRGLLRLHLLLTALTVETDDLARIRAGQAGAALGTIVAMGRVLWGGLTYAGPGGFAEVVAMSLVMAPLVAASLLFSGAVGAFFGGMVGTLLLQVLRRMRGGL